MKYDVFISYSRKDYVDESGKVISNSIVSKIKKELTTHRYTYWFDEDGIYSGDAFVGVITEAIKNSEIFLFISSKNSNASEWTNHEIAAAKLLKKKTIPFRVDDSDYHSSILMYLAPLDYIDYQVNNKKAIIQLIATIENHYAAKAKDNPLPYESDKKEELEIELNKLNWGALLYAPIWALFNTISWKSIKGKQWYYLIISLGILILSGGNSVLGFIFQAAFGVYMGIKGNRISWSIKKWSSLEKFKKSQKVWLIIAIIINFIAYTKTILLM